jgi:pimeloyl-ACP methyl ester carboxylesterase
MALHRDVSVIQVDGRSGNTLASSQANFNGDTLFPSLNNTNNNIFPQNGYNNINNTNNYSQTSDELEISPSSNLVIPQHLTFEEDQRTFKCCDCDRLLTHCFFLLACCWFMLSSTFARICALGDIILHIVVYIIEIAAGNKFFDAIREDFADFKFTSSCLDLLLLSIFRTISCYWLYGYKRQLDPQVLWAALIVMILSLIYCVVKLCLVDTAGLRAVAIFSGLYTLFEWVVYTILRRRRVLVEQDNKQLDLDVDIESGGYIYYNTQQAPYQSPAPYQAGDNNIPMTAAEYIPNNNKSNENLFTGIDTLGTTTNAGFDSSTSPTSSQTRRVAPVGARRHKSTATMKIGGVQRKNTTNTLDVALNTDLSNNTTGQTQSPVFTPVSNNIYSPSPHYAIVYSPQLPAPVQRLSHPNSQFLTFEGVRIHYKFMINPKYQEYFDYLYSTNKDLNQSAATLPDGLLPHQIPPCMVLIHGFMSTLFNFDHLTSLLGEYSAILIFDRPGFGLSAMLTEEDIAFREYQQRSQYQRQQSVQAEVQKLNKFLLEQNSSAQNNLSNQAKNGQQQQQQQQQQLDPFAGLSNDSANDIINNTATTTTTSTTTTSIATQSTGPNVPAGTATLPPQHLMANVFDFYSLIKAYCPDHHPYRSQFVIRLITTFLHIYSLNHLGVIIGGHHSGGTLALSTLVEYSNIFQQLNSNPLLQPFVQNLHKQQNLKLNSSTSSFSAQKNTNINNNGSGNTNNGIGNGINTTPNNTIIKSVLKSPIQGLILFSAAIYDDGFPPLVKNIFSTSLGKSMVQSLLNSECGTVALKRAYFNPDAIPPGLIQLHKALNLYIPKRDDALYTMALTECQSNVMEGYVKYIISMLSHISVPVLVVHGEEDKIVPITSTNRIIRALSGSSSIQCVRISQCGHLSFEEAVETVANSVDSFLQGRTRFKIYQHNHE